ncbi:alkaline phosphatase family protein [Candidatus Bathyarchaeota archaeon]|nr:alkaline phosphatase family protein [Candidatus Bathyarchaeota archaeon]
MIILALDALDSDMITRYECKNLKQVEYGQTNLSDFQLERTVVLWASFLTGKNMEPRIPIETQWQFKLKPEETFLSSFKSYKGVDVPAFSLKEKNHAEERRLLKNFFDKESGVEEYDELVWKNHDENKKDFFNSLGHFDVVLGYFDLADAIGHLSFGIPEKMRRVYMELDEMMRETKSSLDDFTLAISDHGMKEVGRYGDHSRNGFYSTNRRLGLSLPRITDFYDLLKGGA